MADEQQEQPQFPLTNFGILPDGSGGVVTIHFTPTLFLNQVIPDRIMDELTKQWRNVRKQKAGELQVIQDLMLNKGRENLKLIRH